MIYNTEVTTNGQMITGPSISRHPHNMQPAAPARQSDAFVLTAHSPPPHSSPVAKACVGICMIRAMITSPSGIRGKAKTDIGLTTHTLQFHGGRQRQAHVLQGKSNEFLKILC